MARKFVFLSHTKNIETGAFYCVRLLGYFLNLRKYLPSVQKWLL